MNIRIWRRIGRATQGKRIAIRQWMAFLLAMAIGVATGCSGGTEAPPAPTPAPTPVPYAPAGNNTSARTSPAVLYYLSADQSRLVPTLRPELTILPGETMLYALLGELLSDPMDPSLSPLFPLESNVYILDLEQSQDVVTVNLSGGLFHTLSAYRLYAARAAITNTLLQGRDVRYVNVLVDGQEIPLSTLPISPQSIPLPTGALARVGEDLAAGWIQREGEYNRIMQMDDPHSANITRNATLYFASLDGDMLLPEVREINMECGDLITPVVDELIRGPSDRDTMAATLDVSLKLLSYSIDHSFDGRIRLLELNFSTHFEQFIHESSMPEEVIYASLLRTLCTFLPQLQGLRIAVNGRIIQRVGELSLSEGIMQRSMFPMEVGRPVELYFPRSDGRLRLVTRQLPQQQAGQVRTWLDELFSGPREEETRDQGIIYCPNGFSGADIKGLAFNGDVAVVNISAEGAAKLSNMDALTERAMVFSIVNTIAGAPGVNWVRILVEETPVDSLSGAISLLEPLLMHTGISITTDEIGGTE